MSWFGSNKYPAFNEKVEKATSESIPYGDIDFATALEITDSIRSKQIPAKEAMRLLKKRFMDAENVNIQKSSFKLIDFCIKNGGEHFISEISSKEFMDPLIIMLKKDSIDSSLKQYMLENIQVWSIMVSTNPKFEYINQVYKKLQDDGVEFPLIKDFIDSNLIESKVAPEWEDSDACMICSKLFTFLNRKHHCRSCGGVFCNAHSSKNIEVPELGITIPVRVCDNCYADQKAKRKKHKKHKSISKSDSTAHVEDEDDDLKKAIELSLNATATKNEYIPKTNDKTALQTQVDTDEEDELMNAAIKASLQDMQQSSTPVELKILKEEPPQEVTTGLYSNLLLDKSDEGNTSHHYSRQESVVNEMQEPPTVHQIGSGIRGNEERSIIEFVQLLDKVKSGGDVNSSSLIKLKSDLVLLHPKISAEIQYQQSQIEHYQTLFSKLSVISRLYDDILQTRFNQEQEMIRQSAQRLAPSYAQPKYAQPAYQNQYLSPQETFGQQQQKQQPQVFALQQTGSQMPNLNNLSYGQNQFAQVPPQYQQATGSHMAQYQHATGSPMTQYQPNLTPQYQQPTNIYTSPPNPTKEFNHQPTGIVEQATSTLTPPQANTSSQPQMTGQATQKNTAPIFASLKNLSYAKISQESPKDPSPPSNPATDKLKAEPVEKEEEVVTSTEEQVEEPIKPKEPEIINLIDL